MGKLLGALLEALLQCPEDQECLEDQGCQEADTATQDVSASTCPATWGLDMVQDMDQDLDMDQDQGLEALDLVPHHFLPLVAMEQEARLAVAMVAQLFSTDDPWRSMTTPSATTAPTPSTMLMKRPIRM